MHTALPVVLVAPLLALWPGLAILLVAIDQEQGRVTRLVEGVTLFPAMGAIARAGDPLLVERAAERGVVLHDDHGIARSQGGRDAPSGQQDREIPGDAGEWSS